MIVRAYVIGLLALAVGAVLILLSYGATWVVVDTPVFSGEGSPTTTVELTGRDLVPWAAAMGWVALAGVGGVLATSGWGRRVVGALLLLAGAGAGVSALAFAFSLLASGGALAFVDAALAARGQGAAVSASASAWWIGAGAGGLVTMAVGLVLLISGSRLPTLSRRYERAEDSRSAAGPIALWDALDRGEDPTGDGTGSMGTEEER